MKKIILLLVIALFTSTSASANQNCFLAIENDQIIKQEGDCASRHSPCSTFKIAISLMGYDQGFLTDETNPELSFEKGYVDDVAIWKEPHDPTKWMKNSCVWYSQVVTKKLKEKKFGDYVKKFDYGNQDVSGDKKQNNGLTRSWLASSLQISPKEQIIFLQKLLNDELPVSLKSHKMTKRILFVENLPNGWSFYGKTGSCDGTTKNGEPDTSFRNGWFVGWTQKDNRTIIFANHIKDKEMKDYSGGKKAKEEVKKKLIEIIDGAKTIKNHSDEKF